MMHELANNLISIGNQEMNQKRCAFFRKQQHSLGNHCSLRAMKNCKISLWNQLVRPPRIELGLRVPETLVISFSLRAPSVLLHPRLVRVNVEWVAAMSCDIKTPCSSHERFNIILPRISNLPASL